MAASATSFDLPHSPPRRDGRPRPLAVLVVRTDSTASVVVSVIRELGHSCRLVSSNGEALRWHETHHADLVIADGRAVNLTPQDFCRRLRAIDSDRHTFVLLSDGEVQRDFVGAVRAGADGCLSEPIDRDELEAHLVAIGRVVGAYDALAARNAGLRRDSRILARAAHVDPLTRIANRRALEEDLETLQAHLARYGGRACVAMCDIDEFKRYNDTFGHLTGDGALRRIAESLRGSLREEDRVYRYGGEEFLVILPEQGLESARTALERTRRAVQSLGIAHGDGAVHPILTISIGLAAVGDDESIRDAIARADRALYRAKAQGRNALANDVG